MWADKHFGEDQRISQLSQKPEGLLAVSVLRAMAINLLNVERKQRRAGYAIKKTYKQARQQVWSALERPQNAKERLAFV